jgi:hypothetical protein
MQIKQTKSKSVPTGVLLELGTSCLWRVEPVAQLSRTHADRKQSVRNRLYGENVKTQDAFEILRAVAAR